MYLYNTLSRKKELFKPLHDKVVALYSCGPTVYNYAHIGNLRTYIFVDALKRTLRAFGYKVKHVMNITDVGHLTSDADEGEDKMEAGAKRERKTVSQVAQFYTQAFKKDLKQLNILPPAIWAKATAHIQEQIELIRQLEKKGLTYESERAVYFDVSKLPDYGKLRGRDVKKLKVGAGQRTGERVVVDQSKRNPSDFVLWFKRVGKYKNHAMHWASPWGRGFPGWHIECSAMSMKYLGKTLDIHTGGVDHIGTHHTNEIAESESVTGKKFVNYWLHGEFLTVAGEAKMAKSGENFITLQNLVSKNYHPLSFRYLALTAHYRSKLAFSWEALASAESALAHLYRLMASQLLIRAKAPPGEKERAKHYKTQFLDALADDLNTPQALAEIWKMAKENLNLTTKKELLLEFDKVLGLALNKVKPPKIRAAIKKMLERRELLRASKQFIPADTLRKKIEGLGYKVEDTPLGPFVRKISH